MTDHLREPLQVSIVKQNFYCVYESEWTPCTFITMTGTEVPQL